MIGLSGRSFVLTFGLILSLFSGTAFAPPPVGCVSAIPQIGDLSGSFGEDFLNQTPLECGTCYTSVTF